VHDAETLKIICQFHGAKVEEEADRLRAEILEIVHRKAARGIVAAAGEDGLEITGELDRQAVETLRLEIHRMATRHRPGVTRFRVEHECVTSGGARGASETARQPSGGSSRSSASCWSRSL